VAIFPSLLSPGSRSGSGIRYRIKITTNTAL
jgi:hypothetical protein